MTEVSVKTHLITIDVHNEFDMNWCGKIREAKPEIRNGKPIFVVIADMRRVELNTTDMIRIENCAKSLTRPQGKGAVSSDKARIYIKEIDGNEKLIGILTHRRIKTFAPMYDKVGFK